MRTVSFRTKTLIAAPGIAVLPLSSYAVTIGGIDYTVERLGGIGSAGDFTQPTYITQAPGDNNNLYIVERREDGNAGSLGRIVRFDQDAGTQSTFLDVAGQLNQDGGILTVAFHPDFQNNGLLYTTQVVGSESRVVEYDANNGFSSRTLLAYDQPPAGVLHTVNWVGFQPGSSGDELFVLTGDGGFQANNGNFDPAIIENTGSPYGKLLTLDTTANYTNPVTGLDYVSGTGTSLSTDSRASVIANGFRNPYRGAFDDNGGLFIGDVGFQTTEEISYITAAQIDSAAVEDFGWVAREGSVATPTAGVGGPKGPNDIDPVFDYLHNGIDAGTVDYTGDTTIRGASITSGYLINGRIWFGDFVTGEVYSGAWDGAAVSDVTRHDLDLEAEVNDNIQFVVSFGTDNEDNLYIVKFGNAFFPGANTGEIFKLTANIPDPNYTLSYDAGTGELLVDTLGGDLTAYLIRGSGFLEENHSQLLAGVITSDDDELAEADPLGTAANGVFSLGNVLPTNLSLAAFQTLITQGEYTTANGEPVSAFELAYLATTGDLDLDGDVDDADFGLAFAAFTGPDSGPSSNPDADLDGDGDVDDADFALAFAAFTGPLAAANVPEPTSLALLSAAGLLGLRRRRA